jgi:hypothetical protein
MTPAESFIAKTEALLKVTYADAENIDLIESLQEALAIIQTLIPKPDPVPFDDIMSLYHNILHMLPKVIRLNDKRRKHLAARWNESPEQKSLDFWASYFRSVAASDFLTGKTSRWSANFDWLVNPTNILKVREGNYRNREDKSGAAVAANQLFDSVKLEQQRRFGARSI